MLLKVSPKKAGRCTTSTVIHQRLAKSLRPLEHHLYPRIEQPDASSLASSLFDIPTNYFPRLSPPTFASLPQPSFARLSQPSFPGLPQYSPLFTKVNPLLCAASVAPSISFLKLLLVFTAGGLFFSTVIAAVTASYAVGMDNVKRIFDILFLVIQRVWITFTLGLGATRFALLGEGITSQEGKKQSWKWKKAWKTFKLQLSETRRTAAEGVQAIRQEAKIYAAAVGPPGLIPLQYTIDRMMPLSFAQVLEDVLKDSLCQMKPTKTVKKVTLTSFKAGTRSPVLQSARVYDVENSIAFDYDVHWDSELEAKLHVYTVGGLARVPVTLKHIKFDGVVRIILTPLTKKHPGFGACLISLPSPPKIGLDVRVAGSELTKLPWLRSEVLNVIQKGIADQLLWPRRVVLPSMEGTTPILSSKELKFLEQSDPLLVAERALLQKPVLRESRRNIRPSSLRKRMKVILTGGNGTIHEQDADIPKINGHPMQELLSYPASTGKTIEDCQKKLSQMQDELQWSKFQELLDSEWQRFQDMCGSQWDKFISGFSLKGPSSKNNNNNKRTNLTTTGGTSAKMLI